MSNAVVISGRSFSSEVLRRIEIRAASEPDIGLTGLAEEVCRWQHWIRVTGEPAVGSCSKALRILESRGQIILPWKKIPRKSVGDINSRHLIAESQKIIDGRVDQLKNIELLLVERSNSLEGEIWKEMIGVYHYLGYQRLVGAQLRYLIRCKDRWLGGIGFAASAFQVADRDAFIGWSKEARLAHLSEVVSNARFVLLPWVKVKNLASKVLSLVLEKLTYDWQKRYGYRPLLVETYVEKDRFRGICYRAAGWTYVGSTRGRGRQDFNREQKLAVKDIFVYPLAKGWQRRLCRVPHRKKVKTQEAEDNESQNDVRQHWVEREFWDTPLADKRLIARLIIVVKAFWKCPQGSLLQACSGSEAKVRAAYRFLKNDVVTMEKVLRPHIASTVERIRKEHKRKVVLAIQDTTTLNYTTHLQTDGLGYIGTTAEGAQGFFVHDTLALTPDGLALGLLDVQAWARDNNKFGKKKSPNRSIEAKESIKWLKSFESVAEAQRLLPETKLVSVADREGDVFELFSLARSRRDHPELLVRAEYDRCIEYRGKRQKLLAAIGSKPVECYQMIDVPRKSARRGKQGQAARQANLAIRFAEIFLLPPQRLAKSELPLQVWVVQALEEKPPSNIEPLHWLLLSTMPVTNALDAQEKIDWYRCRFLIEVYHKTFKSGCGIEERRHHRLHSLKNALALDMVVAWRIMYLMGLGRSTPNVPCTVIFEKHEWQAMYGFLHETTCVPKETPSLSEAMGMVAKLGGFLGRKGDGEPGITSAWKGLTRLEDISTAWRIFRLKEKL